jgi:hypothetical protein
MFKKYLFAGLLVFAVVFFSCKKTPEQTESESDFEITQTDGVYGTSVVIPNYTSTGKKAGTYVYRNGEWFYGDEPAKQDK